MLKSILIRNFKKEVSVALDPECKDPGYLLGRLFALFEAAQLAALGKVGANVKDKFYATASKHPRRVFGLLAANAANHLSQLGKRQEWRRIYIDRQIAEVTTNRPNSSANVPKKPSQRRLQREKPLRHRLSIRHHQRESQR
jgi:CRISPR-associated protein Csd1